MVGSMLKGWCRVWVATTSEEVHLTQGLLEAQGNSQRLKKLREKGEGESSVTPEVQVKY